MPRSANAGMIIRPPTRTCSIIPAPKHAPWYVVPADHKWFTRLAVAAVIYQTLKGLKLAYPTIDEAHQQELLKAKEMLENES